jgi:nitroreductase
MDFHETIRQRCSVRGYADQPVGDEVLRRVLEAARLAPTARNRQEWKLVVVTDAEKRKQLAESSEQDWLATAPVILAIVGLTDYSMFCGVPADAVDCAIVLDHLSLAATAEGLGTCWIGHFKQDPCKQILGVPKDFTIIELMTLGHPSGQPSPDKPRKALKELLCWEAFT